MVEPTTAFDKNPLNTNKTVSGATTGAYIPALTMFNGMGAAMQIKNTHVSATMFYRIDVYESTDDTAIAWPIKTETGIAANTAVLDQSVVIPFAMMVVSVKQNSGAGTYQIDCMKY